MKIWFIFLGIAAMAVTWWWLNRARNNNQPRDLRQKINILGRCLIVGVSVYFLLLLAAVIFMSVANA